MGAKERQQRYLMSPKNKLKVTWRSMLHRCYSIKDKAYYKYGAKGITVDKDWHNYENFYRDMGSSYKEGLTIDRIDGTKGYSKDNCRWATYYEQNINRNITKYFEYNGEKKTITQWGNILNIKPVTLLSRIYKRHWSVEDAFTIPIKTEYRNTLCN